MYTREQLQKLKVTDLKRIVKSMGIKKTSKFNKEGLIDAILQHQQSDNIETIVVEQVVSQTPDITNLVRTVVNDLMEEPQSNRDEVIDLVTFLFFSTNPRHKHLSQLICALCSETRESQQRFLEPIFSLRDEEKEEVIEEVIEESPYLPDQPDAVIDHIHPSADRHITPEEQTRILANMQNTATKPANEQLEIIERNIERCLLLT